MKKTIGIIGAGNMGGAIYRILKQSRLAKRVYIYDKHANKTNALKARADVLGLQDLLTQSDIIILAVKPQSFKDLADEIGVEIKNKLIVSVMAGVSTQTISGLLKSKKIIRAMPNMAARIGQGVVGWFANKPVLKSEKTDIARLLSVLGLAVEVKKEPLLDVVTAVSGSGPAYFFYLCGLLEAQAVRLGLDKKSARVFATQTFIGSATLLKVSEQDAGQLCLSVISRKGTTAAAMEVLKKNGFAKIFERALSAAFKRARELSKLYE
ncbi:MAG: pyrroline-5-carboxylate reductase [Candidatus Magasanikbacteria bacterium]|nr:pyrroline-5-carboxylate reductase [Candidatus Magasanikbacteria bacterium]